MDMSNKYVIMVKLDSVVALTIQVVEWRSAWMATGVQYVVVPGLVMMPT